MPNMAILLFYAEKGNFNQIETIYQRKKYFTNSTRKDQEKSCQKFMVKHFVPA